jgi:glycosyltransferase involved in cell wall biosynthesis
MFTYLKTPRFPLVSVIIPTFNRATKVIEAIESVLQQTYSNYEIIVADDGSTDETADMMKTYPDVQYLQLNHGGQASARNQGFLHAKGVYFASLDSDDTWDSTFLEKSVHLLQNTGSDFVFSNWMQETEDKEFVNYFSLYDNLLTDKFKSSSEEFLVLENNVLRQMYLTGCYSPSSACVIRRSSFTTRWNEELKIGDDWCVLMDMIFNKPCKAAVIKTTLWTKKRDGQNIFDGQNFTDVLARLWVDDMAVLYNRFRKSWTKEEEKSFKKKQANHLVLHSYYQLTLEKRFRGSFSALQRAIYIDRSEVFNLFSKQILKSFGIF